MGQLTDIFINHTATMSFGQVQQNKADQCDYVVESDILLIDAVWNRRIRRLKKLSLSCDADFMDLLLTLATLKTV